MIVGLQELERVLKPYYAENPDARVWRSPADRAQCAQMANECNALLEEVVKGMTVTMGMKMPPNMEPGTK